MNLKSQILCVSDQHLVKQPSSYYYTLISHSIENPWEGKIENGVAYAPKAKASFALAHTQF